MSVDVAQPWGEDLVLTATGDLALLTDTLNTAAATQQRVTRILLHRPVTYDANGLAISQPDDVFNPTYGAGLPIEVGEAVTPGLLGTIQARILAALAEDAGIASTPAPVVTVTDLGGGVVQVAVSCYTVTGQSVVVPARQLNVGGV